MYLRLRTVEEEGEACTTQEIPDRHAEKTLQRMEEQKRTKRRKLEKRENGREEKRTGTGSWRVVRDRPEASAERGLAACTERESQGALREEEEEERQQRGNTEEADR